MSRYTPVKNICATGRRHILNHNKNDNATHQEFQWIYCLKKTCCQRELWVGFILNFQSCMVRCQHLNCWQVVLESHEDHSRSEFALNFSFFIAISSFEIDNFDRKQTCHSRVILEPLPSDPGTTPEWSWSRSRVSLEPLPSDPGTTPEWSWYHFRVVLEPLLSDPGTTPEWSWNHSPVILEPL